MLKTELRAFHGADKIKEKYLVQVRHHRLRDEIAKGQYWKNGKGCSLGCVFHSGTPYSSDIDHLGIPLVLWRLNDGIFEALPNGRAMLWPEQFLEAIPVGADLSPVFYQFMHWLLADETDGVLRLANEESRPVIQRVVDLFQKTLDGEDVSRSEWNYAANAANAYTHAAYAAAYAAYAAADAAYAYAAAHAADAAADAAVNTRPNARIHQSEKLLELLRAAVLPKSNVVSK